MHQPIHTVYGGAHLFKSTTCSKLGLLAQRSFSEFAPDPASLASVFGIPHALSERVYPRIREKLGREAIEDYRVDFEDGFGFRPDGEEDAACDRAAAEATLAVESKALPALFGIRIRSFHVETRARALRTLDRFLSQAVLPEHFVVTLPKVVAAEEVADLVAALRPYPSVHIEIMVETPQAIFLLPQLVQAAQGRCIAAHFGAYDYTSSLGITAASQDLHHPACEFARSMMLASLAGTGIWLADGATNILPIPPHGVHQAWKLHFDNVSHCLRNGFYQSWDLHPAQIPARLAAVYAFFLGGLDEASTRLRNFREQAEQATRVGAIFDDAATGRGLINYFERAIRCGAIDETDVPGLPAR